MQDEPTTSLTVAECARLLRVTPPTVGRLIEAGKLRAYDVGAGGRHIYRVLRDDLLAFQRDSACPVAD